MDLMKIWEWMDGKKTKLAAMFWLFQEVIVPIWFENGTPDLLGKILSTIAAILLSLGLTHAAVKGVKK